METEMHERTQEEKTGDRVLYRRSQLRSRQDPALAFVRQCERQSDSVS